MTKRKECFCLQEQCVHTLGCPPKYVIQPHRNYLNHVNQLNFNKYCKKMHLKKKKLETFNRCWSIFSKFRRVEPSMQIEIHRIVCFGCTGHPSCTRRMSAPRTFFHSHVMHVLAFIFIWIDECLDLFCIFLDRMFSFLMFFALYNGTFFRLGLILPFACPKIIAKVC